MGILDSVLGGGSQKTETRLPGYITIPSKDISRITTSLINDPKQRHFNPTQSDALNRIIGEATGGAGYAPGSQDFLSDLFASNGLTTGQSALAGGLIGGQFQNPALAETMRVAFGGDVGSNPWLDASFNRAADVAGENFRDNVVADMDQGFAASGRLGSKAYAQARGSAEDAYGRQLNDLANEVYGGAYQTDMARKDAALGQLAGLGQQDVQNRIAGAGLFQQGTDNMFGGVSAMPTVDASRYSDLERLFQAGNTIQQQPWQSLNMGADIIARLQHGTSTQQQNNPNKVGQLIGYGTSLMGMFRPQQQATA
jgi:hypothetical protein